MDSVWSKDIKRLKFDALKGNKDTDVLIIGGGIAGILCAYELKQAGVDCLLVEADKICGGITQDTTAKITVGHGLIYQKLIKSFGKEKARLYLQAHLEALETYRYLCKKIACDYENKSLYIYSLNDRKKIEDEIDALKSLGFNAKFSKAERLPFGVSGAVCLENQAEFNPLRFLMQIAKNLPIYEDTKVIEIAPDKAVTQYGEINYKRLIVATHFPILNKHGGYFLKMYQHRSYVLALEGAPFLDGMYVDETDTGLSFRNYKNFLLLGGGGHRTGKSGGNFTELENFKKKYYPDSKIVYRWATQDCMTLDSVAYIGRYSKHTPNLFVATGFNKWGMTSAMVSANILCDILSGKENRYFDVFSPARSVVHPQLAINAFEAMAGLLTFKTPRCPHMGCALKYNSLEHSWDCSCHGSRFNEEGQLINNPATDDLKFKP